MRRVLVVDDEILVRMGIRSLLEGRDYEVAGEAAGGREALELAERLRPDLVLTDLIMAEGPGLELIRRLRDPGRGGREAIVVLSCRNDFDLVREAMRAGADDYVFKLTLTAEELSEAFERALAKRPRGDEGAAPPPEGFAEALCRLAERPRGAAGRSPAPPPVGLDTGLTALERPFRIMLLDFGPGVPDEAAFGQLARELRRADPSCLESAALGRRAVLALRNEGRTAAEASFALAEEYGRRYFGRLPVGGLSGLGSGPTELESRFHEASAAADWAYRKGGRLAFFDDRASAFAAPPGRSSAPGASALAASAPTLPSAPAAATGIFQPEAFAGAAASLRRALEALDEASAREALKAALAILEDSGDRDRDALRSLAAELLSSFSERARALGFELADTGLDTPAELVGAARSLAELSALLPAYSGDFLAAARRKAGFRKEIEEVRRWVLTDLSRAYSVDGAAARAGMSPSHFAHVWKRELGMSFIDFVNERRMERARELLLSTDLLVREIAEGLGMESLNHFGSLFKRRFGQTPNELRATRSVGR